MNQSRRLTPIALGLAAILILGGSIAAAAVLPKVIAPSGAAQASPGAKDKPGAEKVQAILDRLGAAGITTTADDFNALSDKYGVGGAVRVLAFAHAAGKSTGQITAMVDAGKGWGQIRRELNLTISPGIGWLMGQGQEKADKASGDKKDKVRGGTDADDDSEGAETDDDSADD